MKRAAIDQDLVPVQEFRAGLARWIGHAERTGRPVVVTQRGRAAGVLITPAMFEEMEESRELIARTLRGLEDAREGRLVDDAEVWSDVDEVIAAAAAPPRRRRRPRNAR